MNILRLWYGDEVNRQQIESTMDKLEDYDAQCVIFNLEEDLVCLMEEVNELLGYKKYLNKTEEENNAAN